ncbi:acyl-CoA dehydrogenase family protein [Profundibacterium mesophilum]|uniref:Isoquinoline 1-oxidoreductase n=1 Tax=Profundibacterium mesophilum KAUST100406-0324 TaxID=1037889 RepID=A0A921NT27_9RHOB|nr:acyl-CoA dehydrogenase family protein [Profundibacterium mesophilum]KAF0676054.1 isoquinoline 1-oxidoreductase [Profundibacterium mesophilum KAUST100406-0324]
MIKESCDAVAALAGPERADLDMVAMVEAMRRGGLLGACAPGADGASGLAHYPADPAQLHEALVCIGEADLSAGRIFEGHVNAVKLVDMMGRGETRADLLEAARHGALFGVWGAEGPAPVRIKDGRLAGEKLFASGANVIDHAVITAKGPDGQIQLVILPKDRLEGRLFPEEWHMSGMQATASGRCDLNGIALRGEDFLGAPGQYLCEPHFQGGVWRYAAVQAGAMRAMTRSCAAQLDARGQLEDPVQIERLRQMTVACETCLMWTLRAARAVEAPDTAPVAAATSIMARLQTAREATGLIAMMDDALGAASFAISHPVERRRRDLQVYLRQAGPDAMGRRAMRMLLDDPQAAGDWALA